MHCNGTFTLNMGVWCNAQYLIFRGFSFFFGKNLLDPLRSCREPLRLCRDPRRSWWEPRKELWDRLRRRRGGKVATEENKSLFVALFIWRRKKQYRIDFLFMCLSANTSAASFAHFLHSLLGPPRLCAPGWNKRVSSLNSYSCLWILTLGAAADVKAVVSLSWWHFEEPQLVWKLLHFHFWLILNFSTFTFFST